MENCAPTDADEERDLLATLAQGETSAFWLLWQKYSHRLFRICLREMRGNREDAEDALARAMMRALARMPPFAAEIINPGAWLVRLTCNLCNDIHREDARRREATANLTLLIDAFPVRESTYSGLDPESMITVLPPRLRDVLALRVLQQLPYDRIAKQLAISCVTARKRVQEARAVLRSVRDRMDLGVCAMGTSNGKIAYSANRKAASTGGSRARAAQKIATLRTYLVRHPNGWKMRLRLADLLYATGQWAEAADCYRRVLAKRPDLAAVAAKLDAIAARDE